MKKFILFAFCLLAVAIIVTLPDIQPHFSDGSNLLLTLATGPAFAPLKWPTGQNNMGGYKSRLLFIPFDAPEAVPEVPLPSAAKGNDELVTATGSFTFPSSGNYTQPVYLYSTEGEVDYNAEPQGETDGISYKPTLSFFFPGNTPGMHAFNALVKNTPGYYVFEDVDGRQILLGQPGLYANTSPSFKGGKARADRRGTTYTATADSNYTAIFLQTPIDMEALAKGQYAPGVGGEGEGEDPSV